MVYAVTAAVTNSSSFVIGYDTGDDSRYHAKADSFDPYKW